MKEPVLEEKYTTDVSRETVLFFESKGVSLDQLLAWQRRYPSIIYPWDEYYNSYRLGFNRVGQFFPRMIVMSRKRKDAQWALAKSLELDIEFALKSGAHDPTNFSLSNGVIIDLSKRNYIKVCGDNIVKIGAGVLIGPLVTRLAETDEIIPTGTCQNVGIAGLSMGAGVGFLERLYGLTLDNMLSVTMILADGSIITADKNVNPNMYWAIRGGGGGSLGIVTDFTFRTYDLCKIMLFELWCPFENFEKVLEIWQKWAPNQVNNLTSQLSLYSPSNENKKNPILINGQFEGNKHDLKKLLCVFDGLFTSYKIWCSSIVDAAITHATPNPPLFFNYLNLFSPACLSQTAIKNLMYAMLTGPPSISIEFNALGGAVAEICSSNTAFFWRDSLFWMLIRVTTNNQRELEQLSKWVRSTYNQLLDDGLTNPKTGVGRSYCNFKDLELNSNQYPQAYWGDNIRRLSKIKTKYDPRNVFVFQQSIPLSK